MKRITVLVITLVMFARAHATVLLPTDLADLARDARTIARGRVVAVDAQVSDDRREIETVVTLEVDEYLKGPLGTTLQFRVPGGRVGRYRRIYVGAPEFSIDQSVIVFLAVSGPSFPYIVGLGQGVFRLTPSGDGSGWVVQPPPLLPSAGAAIDVRRGDPRRVPMPLRQFEARVRAFVKVRQ
jgi:hypothetical protein